MTSKEISARQRKRPVKSDCKACKVGFKLLRKRANGTLGSLFINRKEIIPVGQWMQAEEHRTKGYYFRPGWHIMLTKSAPHLTEKGRVWARVAYADFETLIKPESQGGKWALAQKMMVLEVLV